MPAAVDWSARYEHDKNAEPRAGDAAIGLWSREELVDMDLRFQARVVRALRSGDERAEAATATVRTR
jgi:hypothetical protein